MDFQQFSAEDRNPTARKQEKVHSKDEIEFDRTITNQLDCEAFHERNRCGEVYLEGERII